MKASLRVPGSEPGSQGLRAKDYLKDRMKVGSKAIELCSVPGTFPTPAGELKPGNFFMASISYQHSININIFCKGWIELILGIPHCHRHYPQKDLAMS